MVDTTHDLSDISGIAILALNEAGSEQWRQSHNFWVGATIQSTYESGLLFIQALGSGGANIAIMKAESGSIADEITSSNILSIKTDGNIYSIHKVNNWDGFIAVTTKPENSYQSNNIAYKYREIPFFTNDIIHDQISIADRNAKLLVAYNVHHSSGIVGSVSLLDISGKIKWNYKVPGGISGCPGVTDHGDIIILSRYGILSKIKTNQY